eukprot:m.331700 g.331700  ORF g.331700 m.331700 type:complete len:65 (-) comp20483_c1_seq14:269-463(-)
MVVQCAGDEPAQHICSNTITLAGTRTGNTEKRNTANDSFFNHRNDSLVQFPPLLSVSHCDFLLP